MDVSNVEVSDLFKNPTYLFQDPAKSSLEVVSQPVFQICITLFGLTHQPRLQQGAHINVLVTAPTTQGRYSNVFMHGEKENVIHGQKPRTDLRKIMPMRDIVAGEAQLRS